MDIILRNSGNNKTPDPHILLRNSLDEINLKRSDECFALANFSIYYTEKNIYTKMKIIQK